MLTTTDLRPFLRAREDLPAFRAGSFVVLLLAAFLFNVGAFAVLLYLEMALRSYADHQQGRGGAWRRALALQQLYDAAFLLVALTAGVYLRHVALTLHLGGLSLAGMEVVMLLGVTLPKYAVLRRLLRRAAYPFESERAHKKQTAGLRLTETLSLLVCTVGACLLVAAPWILNADSTTLVQLFAEQMLPWKL